MGISSSMNKNDELNNNMLIRENGSLYLNVDYIPSYLPKAQKLPVGILIKPQLKATNKKKMVRFVFEEGTNNY